MSDECSFSRGLGLAVTLPPSWLAGVSTTGGGCTRCLGEITTSEELHTVSVTSQSPMQLTHLNYKEAVHQCLTKHLCRSQSPTIGPTSQGLARPGWLTRLARHSTKPCGRHGPASRASSAREVRGRCLSSASAFGPSRQFRVFLHCRSWWR